LTDALKNEPQYTVTPSHTQHREVLLTTCAGVTTRVVLAHFELRPRSENGNTGRKFGWTKNGRLVGTS